MGSLLRLLLVCCLLGNTIEVFDLKKNVQLVAAGDTEKEKVNLRVVDKTPNIATAADEPNAESSPAVLSDDKRLEGQEPEAQEEESQQPTNLIDSLTEKLRLVDEDPSAQEEMLQQLKEVMPGMESFGGIKPLLAWCLEIIQTEPEVGDIVQELLTASKEAEFAGTPEDGEQVAVRTSNLRNMFQPLGSILPPEKASGLDAAIEMVGGVPGADTILAKAKSLDHQNPELARVAEKLFEVPGNEGVPDAFKAALLPPLPPKDGE